MKGATVALRLQAEGERDPNRAVDNFSIQFYTAATISPLTGLLKTFFTN
jgi:hypothetical protein